MLFIFGILPRLPDTPDSGPLPQDERLSALRTARAVYAQLLDERRIKLVLRAKVPAAAEGVYEVDDRAFVWREGPRHWTGPFEVLGVAGIYIYIYMGWIGL